MQAFDESFVMCFRFRNASKPSSSDDDMSKKPLFHVPFAMTFRVSMEGIHFLLPYMTKRKVSAGPEDFAKCISGEQQVIPITHFSPEFAAEMVPFSAGPVVVLLKGYETDYKRKMFLVMWRCRSESLNCLVSKAEMEGMKSKLAALTAETSKVS